jgi:DNA ligase-associated metallophosphoesterase
LFAADVHLGKGATFRAQGVPLPRGTTRADLQRLSEAVTATGAGRLVVLGDLFHAADGMTDGMLRSIRRWRKQHRSLDVLLVRGNHDRNAGPAPSDLAIREQAAPVEAPPLSYGHRPDTAAEGFLLCGHAHPAVKLRLGGERVRLPCFHHRGDRLVLPAFGEFTGAHTVSPTSDDGVYVLTGEDVVCVSP